MPTPTPPVQPLDTARPSEGLLAGRNPVVLMIAGAICTSASATFVKLADTNAGTAAFFRCALALVVLAPLAWHERRRLGRRPRKWLITDVAAGFLLGIDFVFWAASVLHVGAAIATVLINVQVVVFPLLARLFTGDRLPRRFVRAVPTMLAGVALASGAIGHAEPGISPYTGVAFGVLAGVAYAGYLFLMRLGGGRDHTVVPVTAASASAAAVAALLGGLWTGIDWTPDRSALGWLIALALLGQVLTWLLVSAALPRLTPSTSGTLLLLHPVLGLVLGMSVLNERPTPTQLAGAAIVVVAIWYSTRTTSDSPAVSTSATRHDPSPPPALLTEGSRHR